MNIEKRLNDVARARCVPQQLYSLSGDQRALFPNVPMHAFFNPKFTLRILEPTAWINEDDMEETGAIAHNALVCSGVLSVKDILGRKGVVQGRVIPGQKTLFPLTLEQIVFTPGMTARAAALTLDMLQALGHRVESVPDSWSPLVRDDSPSPVLSALGIDTDIAA